MTATPTSRLAQAAFAVLVVATLAAFFVAQRLKQEPSVISVTVLGSRSFSPVGHGARSARLAIRLKHSDDITVEIVRARTDEPVRRLVTDRTLHARQRLIVTWDGRRDNGRLAPDGRYRVQVLLRRQGRSTFAHKRILLLTTPPRPIVTVRSGPTFEAAVRKRAPAVLPVRGGNFNQAVLRAKTRLRARKQPISFLIYRTDVPGRPQLTTQVQSKPNRSCGTWDGKVGGRPVPEGTYFIAARVRDKAGNVGTTPVSPNAGGSPGVSVRYLTGRGPLDPVRAGARFEVAVAADVKPYRWTLRRLGKAKLVATGTGSSARLRLRAPGGGAGLYLVELSAGTHRTTVPVVVNGAAGSPVLVVLPLISWQGSNPLDDRGSGFGDTLATSTSVSLARPFAGNGLPQGFDQQEGPLLSWFDHHGLRYELTTDVALAEARRPTLAGHTGVVLAGNPRWLPTAVGQALRRYALGGGNVFSLGTESLRAAVELRGQTLAHPTALAAYDLFGARIGPIVHRAVRLLAFSRDSVQLFAGTDGLLRSYDAYEETATLGPGATLAAGAGVRVGHPVLLAERFGKGLVLRTGLPQWSSRLGSDPNTFAITRRIWTLLSR
ncbi:MAG TPA: N,N-dimethylformamidase beta subunit family domain-containing protein [Solirubrobacteraceae bacterium]|nr:N,N-dimethylformamidase beta subunit family domain-containing protein [Solirubrobacteraceae bacterium]